MFVLVQHHITSPEKFWGNAEQFLGSLPKDLKLHATYPNTTGNRATCVWECSSLEALEDAIEKYSSGIARNEYTEIDTSKAIGLPQKGAPGLQAGAAKR